MAGLARSQSHQWLLAILRPVIGGQELQLAPTASLRDAWEAACRAGGLSQEELAHRIAAHYGLRVADLSAAQPTATKLLPASVVHQFEVFPLREDNRHLFVATSAPIDLDAEQAVRFASGRTPVMEVASPVALLDTIALRYSEDRVVETILQHIDDDVEHLVQVVDAAGPAAITTADAEQSPIIKLSNLLLRDAMQQGASDVHIEPAPSGGVVRFRVDGMLHRYMQLPRPVLDRVVSRIKVLGHLDITNRLRPQDGRTTIAVGERRIDLRISTVPTRDSEKAVIRLLDPVGGGGLESVGIPAREIARFRKLLTHREGIVVVTGPTGSGKTTTLYAALRELSTEDVNIMTVEDPVEYELKGMTQLQVEPRQGVTFASALRAILRQDPDIIFVGEIRDLETAEMAVQASLTGHLVLATLHTSSAVGSVRRLCDLGLDPAAVADTLRGAVAQRLARRLCATCAVPADDPLTAEEASLEKTFGLRPVMREVGCADCGRTGYRGRFPIVELLQTTPALQSLIRAPAGAPELHEVAVANGMRSLREAGLDAVRRGDTSLAELHRMLGDESAPAEETGTAGTESSESSIEPGQARESGVDEAPRTVPGMAAPVAAAPVNGLGHVLVVDDEPTNRTFVRGLLQKAGFRVSEAPDGLAALDSLGRDAFDLMVLDLDMPRLAGYEVLSHVRRQIPTAMLPVIVLTGTLNPNAEIEVMERGADDYLTKPIDAARLLARVKAALRRARG